MDGKRDVWEHAMRVAIDAAKNPALRPVANPRVGCTLLSATGDIVGTAAHGGDGQPHAEAAALTSAFAAGRGDELHGGTAVVTLEPCSHVGRTGSCADALIGAGIGRVVYGVADPHDIAAGGAAALRSAGVEVVDGFLAAECEAVDHRWLGAMREGRPWVTWKFAATADGYSAADDGTSQWITGSPARSCVHALRGEHDVILAGTGTVRADNPRLTVRDADGRAAPSRIAPLRVIVGESDTSAATNTWDDAAPTWQIPSRDPGEVLAKIWSAGHRRVFLEGGPTLAAAFLRAGFVDEIHAFVAPTLLGAGRRAVGDLGIQTLDDASRWNLHAVQQVGNDAHLILVHPRTVRGDEANHAAPSTVNEDRRP